MPRRHYMTDDSIVQNGNGSTDDLPQWARDAIRRANNEAAERRVQLKGLEQTLAELKSQLTEAVDAKTDAEKSVGDRDLEMKKLQIALDAGVACYRVRSIAARLQGSNEDELKADAKALIEEFNLNKPTQPQRLVDPTQARGGHAAPVPNTPEAEFAQMWAGLINRNM